MADEKVKELVRRMQKISYRILCDVDDFCKARGITYFLCGGTCLGAVRHQGYIPWDDDVDIMLPRRDYERFLSEFAETYAGKYRVGSLKQAEHWVRPASRIWDTSTQLIPKYRKEETMGVFVDVFPMDGVPENAILRKAFYFRLRVLNFIRAYSNSVLTMVPAHFKHKTVIRIFRALTKPFHLDGKKLAEMEDAWAKKYDFDSSKYVAGSLGCHYWDRETIERRDIIPTVDLPFEDRLFPVPCGYDRYLKNLYGDYMTIPKDAAERGYSHLQTYDIPQ